MLRKLIVCLTGMPGSGKSTIAAGLESKGYETVNMGDAVRAEAKSRRIEPTAANLGALMLGLREKNGPGAVAELVRSRIEDSDSNVVIIDGIRSSSEIDVLKRFGNVKLLAVHASSNTRFDFLQRRGRSDDPQTRGNFEERDDRELAVGISNPIALSEEVINNNRLTKAGLVDAAFEKIQRWLK